jgi:hypothetical protein
MDRVKVFEEELQLIKRRDIREFTEYGIKNLLPDYFFEIPASSTGKYHPNYAQGKGGLVRHTQALVRTGIAMSGATFLFPMTSDELDIFVSAGIMHDGLKSGEKVNAKFTVHEHPILMGDAILNDPIMMSLVDEKTAYTIVNAIKSHMGQWNTNNYSNVVLPRPQTKLEMFLHLADYLASRKFLELNFDVPVSRVD